MVEIKSCAVFGHDPMRFTWGFDEEAAECCEMKMELAQQIMVLRQRGVTHFSVADHCSNIAGCVLETQHRSLDLHEYLDGIKQSAPEFRRDYEIYSRKYALISA